MAIWSDFDIEMNRQTDGDITRDEDIEAIKNSITNILQTLMGSRRMLPDFASNLQNLLFEPVAESTATRIGSELLNAISKWENRIRVDSIHIEADPNNNLYNISLNFLVLNTNKTDEFIYILKQI